MKSSGETGLTSLMTCLTSTMTSSGDIGLTQLHDLPDFDYDVIR
jgi:hypothetical protein